jgi:RHS repeat-associated protein
VLTGATGANEGASTYDPYGNISEKAGTATTPLGYDGQYTNADTGLIYLRSRTYDPATAQFISVDPLVAITRETYGYAEHNPVNELDPSGLGNWLGLGIPSPGEAGKWVAYQAIRVAATIPYAAYYASYRTLSSIGSIPVIGNALTYIPGLSSLHGLQYLGLKADQALDNFKRKVFCNEEEEADEGRGIPSDPWHVLPYVYGPGLHRNGREDLYPEHSYPWWEGVNPNRNPE